MLRLPNKLAGHVGLIVAALFMSCVLFASVAHPQPNDDALRQRIEEFVRARSDDPPSKIAVPSLGDFELPGVDPGSIRVDLSARDVRRPKGTFPVTVVLSDARRVLKRGVVSVRVLNTRRIVIAARGIRRGDLVGHDDLRVEERDAATLSDSATADPQLLVGMVASRSIASGTPLRTEWVARPDVVQRGQRIRLVLDGSDMRIEATGVAMSKGAVGETIRVLNSDSRREITGRIGADGAVHVAF